MESIFMGQFRNATILLAGIRLVSFSSRQTRSVIRSKQISWEEHVEGMGENRNSRRFLVGKPKEIGCLLDLAFMKIQF